MTQPACSPCIKVCVVDGATGWCLGCARSLSEISGWIRMSEADHVRVLEQLPERKQTLRDLGKLGASK